MKLLPQLERALLPSLGFIGTVHPFLGGHFNSPTKLQAVLIHQTNQRLICKEVLLCRDDTKTEMKYIVRKLLGLRYPLLWLHIKLVEGGK